MILKNTSSYNPHTLKKLVKFASSGIGHSNVELHIKNSNGGLRGRCFYKPFDRMVQVSSPKITNLITAKLPEIMPKKAWTNVKRIKKLWPEGIPLDNWEDAVLFLLAHEFKHVWQDKRERKTKKAGKGEYNAEKFAFQRLNKWREQTGREPILPVKQKNPFGDNKCQTTNSSTVQVDTVVPTQA